MLGVEVGAIVIMCGFLLVGMSIAGGYVMGMVRARQRQGIAEMIQRERIALIERGVEPDKLPSMQAHPLWSTLENGAVTERQLAARRRQGLLAAGFLFAFFGAALGTFLGRVAGDDTWAVGLLPGSIGLALLTSSLFVKAE